MSCEYCQKPYGVDIKIEKGAAEDDYPQCSVIVQLETDTPGIVIFKNNTANGYFEIKYCPMCGRKLL